MHARTNVGATAAALFANAGAKVVALQDDRTLFNGNGLDVALSGKARTPRARTSATSLERIFSREAFWDVECDIRVPAALEGQLTATPVLVRRKRPNASEANDILADRGVVVVPDVICNAGGVTVSYFEWVQDFSSFFWTEDEVDARLDRIESLRKICDLAEAKRISLRTATFLLACERILMARQERGLYP